MADLDYRAKAEDYYGNDRSEILAFLPERVDRLLDVGCGSGAFGRAVKSKFGSEVWGVEPMADAAAVARQRLDRVFEGTLMAETGLPRAHFDVITFNDSLEHFPYPEPPLRLCQQLLAPGGVVVCSLPNVRYFENMKKLLIGMDWEYEKEGILDYTHLRFFTRKSMRRTFESCGYQVLSVTGINPHHWSGWKIRLLNLIFGRYISDMKFLQYVVVARPLK